ncbi:uncharacterized protein EI90DRAFT_3115929 [Cantharellus anzutake]|uniref:uncharacterized protein n=1 Tax=Cantharellus anzutake TaxID=1750568 RepID=UPI00190785D5|nr:uncharacterized protein EI90DRAFT_3115929 [Cantharellus anzutake]KAF8342076.1 hypothetical protein EI90DRAFT_3115929 [Cantharellus anzutake]
MIQMGQQLNQQLEQLLESQARLEDSIECRLTALKEQQTHCSRMCAEKRASQNAPVPLELSQPQPIPPQPVPCQVESSPAPADCKLTEVCSASASPEPLQAHTAISGSGTVPDPIQCHPQPVLDQVENSPAPVDCDLAEVRSASASPEPSQAHTIIPGSGPVPDPTRSSLPPIGLPSPEPQREIEFLENSALAILASAIFLKPSRNTGLHHSRSAEIADQLPSNLQGDCDYKDWIKL